MDEEIATHLEMATRERIAQGESPEEARFAAMREFGNIGLVKEATRRVRISTAFEQLLQDLHFGSRILWHSPGLSATAITLIALVIGGNTTIYSMVHGLLTSPAPGVQAERLVGVGQVSPDSARIGLSFTSYPNYLDYVAASKTVRRLAAWAGDRLTIGVDDGNYAVFGAPVTTGFFETFGVPIVKGRAFREEDDRLEHAGLVCVISDRLWRERFLRTADVVGRTMVVNGQPSTIVGVAAPRFRGANLTPGEDVWLPITAFHDAVGSRKVLSDRRQVSVAIAGQLAPGASLSQAQAEFAALSAQLRAAYPEDNKDRRAVVFAYSVTSFLPFSEMAPRFLALFSIVTLLTLVIVSANVANLMLGRAVVRQREIAVRQSLGASGARILRMVIAENAAVSLTAWVAACLFAWWVSRALLRLLPPSRQGLMPDFTPEWQVAAYAMGLAVIATLAFTVAPALRTWWQPVLPLLKAGEQAVAPGRSRLSNALVVIQLAFAVLLLTSAGLAYRSLSLLDSGDVGFAQDNLLLMTVRMGRSGYLPADREVSREERAAGFARLERIRERLRDVHNVEAVSHSRRVPGPYFLSRTPVWRAGRVDPVSALRRPVGPDYLQVLGLSPLAGRALVESDRHGAKPVAMINQHLAAALFPDQSPLGQSLFVGPEREVVEVIGIAPNALFEGPIHDPRPNFLFVAEQQLAGTASPEPTFFVRYKGSLESIAPAVSKALADVDADAPIVTVRTMTGALESVTELERMVATLLTCFAAGSLIVAVLGQYAIGTFNMRRRVRDFGIRMSLGASSRHIQVAVVREAFELTVTGLLIGFALSAMAGVAFRSALFGITPTDPATYVGVFTLLSVASVLASYLPAWRAGRVNVVEALRQE